MVGRTSAGWPGSGLITWSMVAPAAASLSCKAGQLAAQIWARAGWSWAKSAGMELVLTRDKPKALVPLMDHQVVESVHQASRGGNLSAAAKVVAEWAVVPMIGVPGSKVNGAVAALAAESVHTDWLMVSVDKAVVGRPRTM